MKYDATALALLERIDYLDPNDEFEMMLYKDELEVETTYDHKYVGDDTEPLSFD